MLEIINKAIILLPIVVAINVALSALAGVFQAIAVSQGKAESPVAKGISAVAGVITKIVDLVSANRAH